MTEMGHGLQVVSVTPSHSYILEERDLEKLLLQEDVRDLPVVVVSVAGAYRGGKSFLLNFFLRYLSSPQKAQQDGSWLGEDSEPLAGFKWRSGIKATTMGILMWSEPFITTLPSGEKVAILLVDTQGTFDSKSTVRDNSTVFALSTLISSVQIYNLSHDIKEDDLQHLELFTEYGKLVNSGDSKAKAFQVLEFLVRDWQFPEEPYLFGAVGGERLLQDKLQITPDLAKEMKELREHVRSSFEKVSCFLMPHPGFKVLKPTFKGNISDIDPEFRQHLIDLVNSIFGQEKLLPKTINGDKIKARDLFNYFKAYMELFNSGKIPTPGNIMAMTVKAGLLSAVSEAREIYEKGMDAECGPKQLFVPPVDLKFLHEKYLKTATDFFTGKKKMGSKKEADVYLKALIKELGERLPQFMQSNLSKIQTAINKAKEAYDEETQHINEDQPLCVHPLDLDAVHQAGVDAATKIYDAAQKRVTQQEDNDRSKFIKSFEKQKDDLYKVNKQNNNNNVTELRMEYWSYMQGKAALDPPLSDVEFKKEHADTLMKALQKFDLKRNKPNIYTEDVYKFNLTKGIQDSFVQLKVMNHSKNKEAMAAGIDAYNKYVKDHWDNTTQCVHPGYMVELHRLASCHALEVFHPRKTCSAGFDKEDEDEANLQSILRQRYQELTKNNEDANETAVGRAHGEYLRTMEDKCRFSFWWIFLVPFIINKNKRSSFNDEAKDKALQVFYGARQEVTGYDSSDDPYRKRLDELMEESYNNNYK